ncbi:probable RNA-binding protein EIF1AD [Narcine bancroftii]|uniref:probable RNA-binding protein EIF1AD n=1 Tax=Narcine bancroftii TaxID=1343680 RepID=UPI003832143B
MSQATKRKHVVKEVLGDYPPPSEKQQIVRLSHCALQVVRTPGNNLHEVETERGERFLASMPTKFRKNIWIKRGDFLIVDPIEEGEKVKAEITSILYREHIKQLRQQGVWPASFSEPEGLDGHPKRELRSRGSEEEVEGKAEENSDDDGDLFVNTNRRNYQDWESDEEERDAEEGERE